MADLINIGTSALISFQTALNTTSNNIANVNTDGYVRQRTDLAAITPSFSGGFYLGNGVEVDSVQRIYDQFLAVDVQNRSSSYGSAASYTSYAQRLDALFSSSNSGFQNALDEFYAAVQDVANNPSALPERQALIGQAEQLVDQYSALESSLDQFNQELSYQVEATVEDINSLTTQIAEINAQISLGGTALASSELLDERQRLVNELAGQISIQTVQQTNGSLNVSLADGTSLVTGVLATELTAFRNEFDPFKMEIGFANRVGNASITGSLTGGELGGVLEFREELLGSARNQLGLIGTAISSSFNEQHRLGLDLEGNVGQNFFSEISLGAIESLNNTGSANVTVSMTDVDQLTAGEFELSFDGTDWTLTNLTDNSTQTGAGPFTADGITVAMSGTASAGDIFRISPARDALGQFSIAMTDPRGIAAASAVRAEQPLTNSGTASLSSVQVNDEGAIPLAGDITLTFNPDALGAGIPGFDVTGIAGGPLAYDPATESGGTTLTLGDLQFVVAGTPDAGDTLGILNNTGGIGDNTNALVLSGLQQNKTLLNGTASQQDLFSTMAADVGIKTSRAESRMETEGLLLDQAQQSVDSVSGVNLDEEAADLIRFQQAYQAAAQLISVADTLFGTLLNATSR